MTTAAAQRLRWTPLDDLKPLPGNPQKGHKVARLAATMAHDGFGAPLTVNDATGHTLAGSGRIQALRRMKRDGQPPPRGINRDAAGQWLVPTFHGTWSQRDERRVAVALNGGIDGSLSGELDEQIIAEILRDATPADTGALGLSAEEAAQILADYQAPLAPPAIDLEGIETTGQDATPETASPAAAGKPATQQDRQKDTVQLIVTRDLGQRVRRLTARGATPAEILLKGIEQLESKATHPPTQARPTDAEGSLPRAGQTPRPTAKRKDRPSPRSNPPGRRGRPARRC